MERLLTADDVAAALQVSRRTAYTYMNQMIHLSAPLRVSESSLRAWISERTAGPGEKGADRRGAPAATHGKGKKKSPGKGLKMALVTDYHIPRRRTEAAPDGAAEGTQQATEKRARASAAGVAGRAKEERREGTG